MSACRDGVSWVACERRAGAYDFRSVGPLVRAAQLEHVRVIWDLMHFGWPDHVEIFAPDFPRRFAAYARAFARWLGSESDELPMLAPINEISFLAWAGGDVASMNPFELARGVELKVQLVRATIEAIEAIRSVLPKARFLCGNIWPTLGGRPEYLDMIGVNFYPDNQFMLDGTTVFRGDARYKPFSAMLLDTWQRYRRPMLVSETGSEGKGRADWLAYVVAECEVAVQQGCELHGITLYPIVNHPGWEDDRRCENGLWDYADARGQRAIHEPLASEILRHTPWLAAAKKAMLTRYARNGPEPRQLDHQP